MTTPARLAAAMLAGALWCVAHASGAQAQDAPAADRRAYGLFRPVPAALLRDLSTDRPDRTESPFTVDAGHWQLEMDAVSHTRDRDGVVRTRETGVAAVNLKLGVRHDLDLQVIAGLYTRSVTEAAPAPRSIRSGFGDVTVRAKWNLRGNDGGRVAFSVMPFVSLPTAGDGLGAGAVEGGLIAPAALDLGAGWGLGLMSELDLVRRSGGSGYVVNVVHSAALGRDVAGPVGAYVELFTEIQTEGRTTLLATGDAGLTLALGRNAQLDAGVNLGLTHAAPGVTLFAGLSVRR